MSSQENNTYSIHFDCEECGADWWFTDKECYPINSNRWNISITKEDLNLLINNLKSLKAIIEFYENDEQHRT